MVERNDMYIGITLDTSKLHNMLPMLPPTMFRTMFILHLCFFFFDKIWQCFKKKKKHRKGWSYAKPISIPLSFSLGCPFPYVFSPSQLWLCEDFPDLRFSPVFWIRLKGAIIICNTDIYPVYPLLYLQKEQGENQKTHFLQVVLFSRNC